MKTPSTAEHISDQLKNNRSDALPVALESELKAPRVRKEVKLTF
jgi:hypothetical protein